MSDDGPGPKRVPANVKRTGNYWVLVREESRDVAVVNETGHRVFQQCDGSRSQADIAQAIAATADVDVANVKRDVVLRRALGVGSAPDAVGNRWDRTVVWSEHDPTREQAVCSFWLDGQEQGGQPRAGVRRAQESVERGEERPLCIFQLGVWRSVLRQPTQ